MATTVRSINPCLTFFSSTMKPINDSPFRKILESQGIKVAEAGSVASANEQYDLLTFDLVITELQLPGDAGSELIGLAHPVPVVVMTNYASLRSAVEAMKQGRCRLLSQALFRRGSSRCGSRGISTTPYR